MYYDHLMALTTTTVNGEILAPMTNVPAQGTVTFKILTELRDMTGNVIYSPGEFVATLDVNGQFSIVLPFTDNVDVVPVDWSYWVYVDTDIWTELFFVAIPTSLGDPVDFADLIPLSFGNGSDCTPDGSACAPISVLVDIAALQAGKVNRSGDLMTGDLYIGNSSDLTVEGFTTTSYQGVTGDITEFASTVLGTGVIEGGEFVINANPALLDITAMTGYIVDYNSSAPITPTNPSLTRISLPAQVGLALTGPPSQTTTWWLVDSAGTVIQQAARPSPTQRRTHIVLGATAQFAGTIFIDQTLPVILSQLPNQLVDLIDGLGPFVTSGNVVSANGINLMINKTAGTMFVRAFSQVPNYQDPHNAPLAAQAPCTFRWATATAVLGALQTTIDVANYDPNGTGVVTPVGGGANRSTNFRIWGFGTNLVVDQMAVQYGQRIHASLADAVAGIGTGNYIPNPLFVDGTLLGFLSVTRTATDLSNPAQAVFTRAAKFSTP